MKVFINELQPQNIYAIVQNNPTLKVERIIDVVPISGGSGEGAIRPIQTLVVVQDGQTIFELSSTPPYPERSRLYVNGLKASFGTDYIIDASLLKWLNKAYTIQINDSLEIIY